MNTSQVEEPRVESAEHRKHLLSGGDRLVALLETLSDVVSYKMKPKRDLVVGSFGFPANRNSDSLAVFIK